MGRIPSDLTEYNAAAARAINCHGITVDDMNAFIRGNTIPHVKPEKVHFTKEASAKLASNSAKAILRALGAD